MARISGLERKQAPWHLRWFYGVMRKMFGKDLTPVKLQMRLPELSGAALPWRRDSAESDEYLCAISNWPKSAPPHSLAAPSE